MRLLSNELIYTIVGTIAIVLLLFVPLAVVAIKLFKVIQQRSPSFSETAVCITPMENLKYIRELMYGEAPVYGLVVWLFMIYLFLLIIVRFIVGVSTPAGIFMNTLVSVISLVMVILYYIMTVHCLWDLADYYEDDRIKFWAVLFYPFSAYLLIGAIDKFYRKHPEEL